MIEHNGPTPLYQQVRQLIRRHIEEGQWQVDQCIPSERELCEQYGISRTTVRQAINEAVNEGLLYRIQGKGTFVARPKISQPLFQITGFTQTIRSRGLIPETRLLEAGTSASDVTLARILGLSISDELGYFRLLGLGSGQPMAIYESYLPRWLGDHIRPEVERRVAAGEAFVINEIVARHSGWAYLQAEQTYEVGQADEGAAGLLQLPRKAPVFVITSVFFNPENRPVEYRRATYRGDKYQFHVTRRVDFNRKTKEEAE